jgi:hypothetical protein
MQKGGFGCLLNWTSFELKIVDLLWRTVDLRKTTSKAKHFCNLPEQRIGYQRSFPGQFDDASAKIH